MAKSQDAKKTAKKEPLKTAKEKKEEKREKKNTPKRDQFIVFSRSRSFQSQIETENCYLKTDTFKISRSLQSQFTVL